MERWKEEFKALAISITDEVGGGDFRRCLIDEGFESEERAKELTQFIIENNIDCRGCWENYERYADYIKLGDKMTETWEPVDDEIHYL